MIRSCVGDDPARFDMHLSKAVSSQSPSRPKPFSDLINLSSNELRHPDLTRIHQEFLTHFPRSGRLDRYPDVFRGARELEEKTGSSPGTLAITPGSDLAIRAAMEAFGGSGRVICLVPSYRAYPDYASVFSRRFIGVETMGIGDEQILSRVTDELRINGPALVVATSPDGTNGRSLGLGLLSALVESSRRHGSLLMIDEAYAAFETPGTWRPTTGIDGAIVLRSFSKAYGAAGIRLGLIVGPPRMISAFERTRLSNGVSEFALRYLHYAVEQRSRFEAIWHDIVTWRSDMQDLVSRAYPNLKVSKSNANFVFVLGPNVGMIRRIEEASVKNGVRLRFFHDDPALASSMRFTVSEPDVSKLVAASLGEALS